MYIVGLTGGIGSGKTTIANQFATHGITVVDTDLIAHQLTGAGAIGSEKIAQQFGFDVLTPERSLDRSRMRELVFGNPQKRLQLEAILHPLIRQEAARQIEHAASAYTMLVVPLLTESLHFQTLCDRVLVVDCPEHLQVERVMKRSRLEQQQVEAIIRSQATREARLALADDVIENGHNLNDINSIVLTLHRHYLALAELRKCR